MRVVRGAESLVFGEHNVLFTTAVRFTDRRDGSVHSRSITFETPVNPRLARSESIFRSLLRMVKRPPERDVVDGAPRAPYVPVMLIDELRIDWFNGRYQGLVDLFERNFPMAFDRSLFGDLDEWTCVNCADYLEAGDPLSRIIETTAAREDEPTLSLRDLDCSPSYEGGLVCTDLQLGTYELPWSLTQLIDVDAPPFTVTEAVSHARNLIFRSLTFRGSTVEARTNVFSLDRRQANRPVRLGRFETSMTPTLGSVQRFFQRFTLWPGNESLEFIPHAPIVYVNGRRVHHEHSDFFDFRSAFVTTIEEAANRWTCVDCAEYRRTDGSIWRVSIVDGEESRDRFSFRDLDFHPIGGGRLECVDPEFGIFEIPRNAGDAQDRHGDSDAPDSDAWKWIVIVLSSITAMAW